MTVVSNVYHQLVARLFGRAVLTALCLSLSLGATTALSQETSQPSKLSHTEVSETEASCTPPRLAQSPRTVLRVGYSAFNLSGDKELLLPSLQKVFSPDRLGQPVLFEEFSEDELQRAIESNEVDAVLSSSGFYRQNTTHGLRSLATVVCDEQPDPNHTSGELARNAVTRLRGFPLSAACTAMIYSTVTLLARLRGLSTSQPRSTAI